MARTKKEVIDLNKKNREFMFQKNGLDKLLELLNAERKNPSSKNFNPFFNPEYAYLIYLIDVFDGLSEQELNTFIFKRYEKAGGSIQRPIRDLCKRNIIKKERTKKQIIIFNTKRKEIEKKGEGVYSFCSIKKNNNSLLDLIISNTPELSLLLKGYQLNEEEIKGIAPYLKTEFEEGTPETLKEQLGEKREKAKELLTGTYAEIQNLAENELKKGITPEFYGKLKQDFDEFYSNQQKQFKTFFVQKLEEIRKSKQSIYSNILNNFFENLFLKILAENPNNQKYNFSEAIIINQLKNSIKTLEGNIPLFSLNQFEEYNLILQKYSGTTALNQFKANIESKEPEFRQSIKKKLE